MNTAVLDRPVGSPETAPDALAGFTIGVTATRRREEFCALLERRGARVVRAPAIRLVPLAEDAELLAATRASLSAPIDDVVVTTGVGFRGWMAAAEGWGLSADLTAHLTDARLLTRGPKARGAVRAAGLNDHWTPSTESCEEVKQHLLAQDLRGRRIAVQLHGEPLTGFVAALREAGAEVIEVPVYRWLPYRDTSPLRRLISQAISGGVDAVAFTSAPAVLAMLNAARADGLEDALIAAFAGPVVAACVGPGHGGPPGGSRGAHRAARACPPGRAGPHARPASARAQRHPSGRGRPPAGDPRSRRRRGRRAQAAAAGPDGGAQAPGRQARPRGGPFRAADGAAPAARRATPRSTPSRWPSPACAAPWAPPASSRRSSSAATAWPATAAGGLPCDDAGPGRARDPQRARGGDTRRGCADLSGGRVRGPAWSRRSWRSAHRCWPTCCPVCPARWSWSRCCWRAATTSTSTCPRWWRRPGRTRWWRPRSDRTRCSPPSWRGGSRAPG